MTKMTKLQMYMKNRNWEGCSLHNYTFQIGYVHQGGQIFRAKVSFNGIWQSSKIIDALFHPGGKHLETVIKVSKGKLGQAHELCGTQFPHSNLTQNILDRAEAIVEGEQEV